MIGVLTILGAIGRLISWSIGMASLANGGPKVARYSTFIAMALGLLVILSGVVLPRAHWAFGAEGGGDGFGILGLMIRGALLFIAALVALVIIESKHAVNQRRARAEKQPQ